MAHSQHIDHKVLAAKQSSQHVANNRIRLKAEVYVVRWLVRQGLCLIGNDDETSDIITYPRNFTEMMKLLASFNEDVNKAVLENTSLDEQDMEPFIQKKILHVIARKVRWAIREEIGDAEFSVIVDDARDESQRMQMAIVLRFVDKDGVVQERFFDHVYVADISASNLKNVISSVFSRYNLDNQNLRGQGYDGANDMCSEWNELQALFMRDCPYAYYVHCFSHRLQWALIGASKEVISVCQFFKNLSFIVNAVDASSNPQAANIATMIVIDELQTKNGRKSLQQAGDSQCGSYLSSIHSLVSVFDATCSVLESIISDGTYLERGDAHIALNKLTSFEFVFNLHFMRELLGISHDLCQALQRKSQDIVNTITLVATTKTLLQRLRESGWDDLFQNVKSFCECQDIDIPDLSARYIVRRGRYYRKDDHIDIEHHYRIDIFTAAIDFQLLELNNRFSESTIELLVLTSALDPRDSYKFFKIDDIFKLVDKFYPNDFTEEEKVHLRVQLQHYQLDVPYHLELKNLLTISELCHGLVKTRKSVIYHLVFRLIRLVLTLPISAATTERSFSAMNVVKTELRNEMEDEYLADYLVTYIEKTIAAQFSADSIINDLYDVKEHRA